MYLSDNQLSGQIPSELGSLANLEELLLNDNPGLSGPLPGSFTGLTSLTQLDLSGTGLCAPTDAAFQAWPGGIQDRRGGVNCQEMTDRDSLVARYDENNNDTIERGEVIAAIRDYLDDKPGITRTGVIMLIRLYLDS